jgi:hypothetical protein
MKQHSQLSLASAQAVEQEPELTERGSGGLLFAGGLSSVVPMPPLGGLARRGAAQLRDHPERGAATGRRLCGHHHNRRADRTGRHHRAMQSNPDLSGNFNAATLNPDDLAETVWRLYTDRTSAEAVINALAA